MNWQDVFVVAILVAWVCLFPLMGTVAYKLHKIDKQFQQRLSADRKDKNVK